MNSGKQVCNEYVYICAVYITAMLFTFTLLLTAMFLGQFKVGPHSRLPSLSSPLTYVNLLMHNLSALLKSDLIASLWHI